MSAMTASTCSGGAAMVIVELATSAMPGEASTAV